PRQHLSVVHDGQCPLSEFVRQLVVTPVPNVAGRALVDEEPRAVAPLERPLGDQLGRELVVQLRDVHPTPTVRSAPMTDDAIDRARKRLEEAAEGRPDAAAVDAVLERARAQVEERAQAAAQIEATLPAKIDDALQDGLREQVRPVGRNLAEIRGLSNQVIRRLERIEGDLRAERHARVDDLALLVDLITSGWKAVDDRLGLLEKSMGAIEKGLHTGGGAIVYTHRRHV